MNRSCKRVAPVRCHLGFKVGIAADKGCRVSSMSLTEPITLSDDTGHPGDAAVHLRAAMLLVFSVKEDSFSLRRRAFPAR
jgi:hypothetical protein